MTLIFPKRAPRSPRMLMLALTACLGLTAQGFSGSGVAEPRLRLAAMDPGHVEILVALGAEDSLVLMPQDPSLRNRLRKVSRYQRLPSMEGLLAADTTLIVGGNPGRDLPVIEQAKRLGMDGTMISRELPAIERIRRLAALTYHEAAGEALVARLEAEYAKAAQVVGTQPVQLRVLHVSSGGAGTSGAITAAGQSTAAHGLIERAGGINVGAEAGLERYQTLTAEGVISMAPQAVLVSRLELPALGGADGIWKQVAGLANTPAARDRRLIVLPHTAVKFDAIESGEATLALANALAESETAP